MVREGKKNWDDYPIFTLEIIGLFLGDTTVYDIV